MSQVTSTPIVYGAYTIDPANLPATSVTALLRRGLAHYLGNEQSSRLTSWVVAKVKAETDGEGKLILGEKPDDKAVKAAVKAFKDDEENAEAIAEQLSIFEAEAVAKMNDGTMGQGRVAGPKPDTTEGEMRKIARSEVTDTLKANKLSVPKGAETVDLGGTMLTMDELIDRRLAKHADRLRKEAEKIIKARKAKAEATTVDDLI